MKITRNFGCGDYTFELTDREIEQAFRERELYYKCLDIESKYQEMYNKECPYDEETKRKLAEDIEDSLSKNELYWDGFWASFEMVIEEFEKNDQKEEF